MKKKWIFILCVMSLLSLCATSCQKAPTFDTSVFCEEFRAEHAELFPNDTCEHDERYRPASAIAQEMNDSVYHYTDCLHGNCDYEGHFEAHTIDVSNLHVSTLPQARENGYLYHPMSFRCPKCWKIFKIHVYCPRQDPECGSSDKCLENADWREILCDTPYVIYGD